MRARPSCFLEMLTENETLACRATVHTLLLLPPLVLRAAGKSSVLESISGIPFPRGSGLVTRCATELRMKRGPAWRAIAYTANAGRQRAE
jgi:Dynamin family